MPNYLLPFQFSRTKIKLFCDEFVDRGDPIAYDTPIPGLTTDGNWHDLSLLPLVPAGASAVLLQTNIKDDLVLSALQFRQGGNVNPYNVTLSIILVANISFIHNHIIALDSNAMIQYKATNTTFTQLDLLIRGWWI